MAKKRSRPSPAPEQQEVEPMVDAAVQPVDMVDQAARMGFQTSYSKEAQKRMTRKAKEHASRWQGSRREATRTGYFRGMAQANCAKFGHENVFFGAEAGQMLIGMPLPSIMLEYVFGLSALPINVFLLITGATDSRKSTFLYEIFRWFISLNGGVFLAECETKYNEAWARKIGSYTDPDYPVICVPCDTQDAQQDFITYNIQEHQRRLIGTAEEPGPGRTVPTLFAIDSLTGKFSKERTDKIFEEGHASRNYSIEALNMGPFVSAVMSKTKGWPFMVVAVSHVAYTSKPGEFQETRSKRGGMFKDYQIGFDLELRHAKKLQTSQFAGYEVWFKTHKNSYAPKERESKARMIWWRSVVGQTPEGDPLKEQFAAWDWDWATASLMNNLPSHEKADLARTYGIRFEFQTPENPLTCRIKMKGYDLAGVGSEFVHFRDFGRAVRQDPRLLTILRSALGITTIPIMQGDYADQIERQRGKAE